VQGLRVIEPQRQFASIYDVVLFRGCEHLCRSGSFGSDRIAVDIGQRVRSDGKTLLKLFDEDAQRARLSLCWAVICESEISCWSCTRTFKISLSQSITILTIVIAPHPSCD
jgi:hypothetical protein